MTENKYVQMMLNEASDHEHLAGVWGAWHNDLAADWRAAAEAFEAMQDALADVMLFIPYEKPDMGPRPEWIGEIESRAKAALAKASGT